MESKKITTNDLLTFELLMIENRDSKKLQEITQVSYLESIKLLNKIRKITDK